MKCYNHPEKDAIAICKACGRGTCRECARDSDNIIACRQSCADSLAKKKDLQAKQAAHLNNLKRNNILGSFFSIGMGILFTYFSSLGYGLVYDFVFLIGIGFIVYGIVALLVNVFIFFINRKKQKN